MSPLPPFPVDDATLDLLWDALHPGPEAERSSLGDVLDIYSEMAGSDLSAVSERLDDNTVEMRDPRYHVNDVVDALITEIRRLKRVSHSPIAGDPK